MWDGPASLTATRWKYMERGSGFGASMHRRAASCAGAKTVCHIVAVRRQPTALTPSLLAVPSTVFRSVSTNMAARSRPVRPAVRTWASGLCITDLRWTGPNTRKADTAAHSRTPSAPVGESGRAVMSSRGSIALASARTECRPLVRMTPTRILDRRRQVSGVGRVGALASFGRLTLTNRH